MKPQLNKPTNKTEDYPKFLISKGSKIYEIPKIQIEQINKLIEETKLKERNRILNLPSMKMEEMKYFENGYILESRIIKNNLRTKLIDEIKK